MKQRTFNEKFKYHFDNYMAKGTGSLILGLTAISLVIVALAGLVINLFRITPEGGEPLSFIEGAWESLMRTFDAGTMGGDAGWGFRISMLVVTVGGIFIISTLIGILSNSLAEKLEELKKGRSAVIEGNHTAILGWNPKIFAIIDQLIISNESMRKPVIVILAARDKQDMDQDISERYGKRCHTRIVCRSGSPSSIADLAIANLPESRSIVILAGEDCQDPDMEIIRSIMAVRRYQDSEGNELPLVAEMDNQEKMAVAKIVGGEKATFVLAGDSIARIAAQACRQRGLSLVYQELLDFDGDELYFAPQPALVGRTFQDCILEYRKVAVVGIVDPDGTARVNPPMDTKIVAETKIIGITQDDSTFKMDSSGRTLNTDAIVVSRQPDKKTKPENFLILSWNERVPIIIGELDSYVPAGSMLTVFSETIQDQTELNALKGKLTNLKLQVREGDTTNRAMLESLGLEKVDHVLIMSDTANHSLEESDSRTMLTMINVRDIARKSNLGFSTTSEILDLTNRELVEVMQVDDFIVSDQLVSQLIAQLSENPALEPVFTDFFDADGSEIYLKPLENYIKPGIATNFYSVADAVARTGSVAIGYKLAAWDRDATHHFGVILNPDKAAIITFQPEDRLIVIAEG